MKETRLSKRMMGEMILRRIMDTSCDRGQAYSIGAVSYTHLDVYKRQIYDIEIVSEYEMFDNYYDYNVSNNKIYLLKNKINRPKIRMLFNNGG